jgi:hypothetical protein
VRSKVKRTSGTVASFLAAWLAILAAKKVKPFLR